MAYGGGTISLEQERNLLGAVEIQEVTALADALIAGDLPGALQVIANVAAAALTCVSLPAIWSNGCAP